MRQLRFGLAVSALTIGALIALSAQAAPHLTLPLQNQSAVQQVAGRLHKRWSALPIGTCLGLSSAFGVLLCTLRPLLWRTLALSVTPMALALLVDAKQREEAKEALPRRTVSTDAIRALLASAAPPFLYKLSA
jgi:hypothetical protein